MYMVYLNLENGSMSGEGFTDPKAVLEFVEGLNLKREIKNRCEVSQFGDDGEPIECVSYEDFYNYHTERQSADQELADLLQRFDRSMAQFNLVAERSMETLRELSYQISERLAKTCNAAEADIASNHIIWSEIDIPPMEPLDSIDVGDILPPTPEPTFAHEIPNDAEVCPECNEGVTSSFDLCETCGGLGYLREAKS